MWMVAALNTARSIGRWSWEFRRVDGEWLISKMQYPEPVLLRKDVTDDLKREFRVYEAGWGTDARGAPTGAAWRSVSTGTCGVCATRVTPWRADGDSASRTAAKVLVGAR